MTVSLTVSADNGQTTVLSLPAPVINTSARGLITAFNPASDNWQNPDAVKIDGQQFFVENANKAWSLTKLDDYTFRMEVRPGDLWGDDGTSRSEILTVKNMDYDSVFTATWNMTIEAGVPGNMAWRSPIQIHDGDVPIISFPIVGDIMAVLLNQTSETIGAQPYTDTQPIQRGHTYAMKLEMKKRVDAAGYLKVWRDGVQIVNYTGPLGENNASAYMKFGVYQGWPENATSPIAVRYDHVALDFATAPPPPPPPPLPPGINKVGIQTVGTTADTGNANEILAQRVDLSTAATLQSLSFYLGTAGGNIRLGVYNTVNGRPGTKVAETASSTAAVGWNTKPVIAQVVLQPGTYWLAFELSSAAAGGRLIGSGTGAWSGQAFGTLPSPFPGTNALFSDSWSFYMTVNV